MSGVYRQRNSGEKQETEDFAESRMHGQTMEVAELLSAREVSPFHNFFPFVY